MNTSIVPEKRIYHYNSGNIHLEAYVANDTYHRLDGPACIEYYESGEIKKEVYSVAGEYHRLDGPAYINYSKSRTILSEVYFINGVNLTFFNEYGKNKIFEYIKIYPQYIKEIILFAEYNHWLNEEQLLLLKTIDTMI